MSSTSLRKEHLCGLSFWQPPWLQSYANTRTFMAVYGLLGTIQAMSSMYFMVTLTTLEKRFKISSQTTGIVLSGNEVSQILLSLILSYFGGQRNRPRWIAWGMVFCALSSYIITLPHFLYGPGEDSIQLTEEFFRRSHCNSSDLLPYNVTISHNSQNLCNAKPEYSSEIDTIVALFPLILIFLSQFVLGIGNTMYYSLGQTYLDDNTKKTNTPMMLATAMSLRMAGPIMGFFLGYVSLNMFIDTTRTPIIDKNDPRWLGAWWFGWLILGSFMLLFSGLMGMFPKELPKKKPERFHSEMPKVLQALQEDEGVPLSRTFTSNMALDNVVVAKPEFPTLKNFPKALMRLLKNKLLLFNIISSIFYLLGASGYMTFLTKYMEIQFQKNAQNATVIIGPVTILGMVLGLMTSGVIISKKKPSASKVLFYNVICGFVYIVGQVLYIFLYCGNSSEMLQDGKLNIVTSCNTACACDAVPYSPVCHVATDVTYFSPCHAGCRSWNSVNKTYTDCLCVGENKIIASVKFNQTTTTFGLPSDIPSTAKPILPTEYFETVKTMMFRTHVLVNTVEMPSEALGENQSIDHSRFDNLTPGACIKSCKAFWLYIFIVMVVNWFGSSGRVGNMLVNYRAVATEDKSFAQGLTLMMFSIFAAIPGPILFGRVIDSTCLVWTEKNGVNGNCQLYDQTKFRHYVNLISIALTMIGVVFDMLVWHYGKHLDLYGEMESKRLEEFKRKNTAISPLLQKTLNSN